MDDLQSSVIPLVAVTFGLGLVTFVVITTTSFVKISVVLFLVRNALGIQQTPPNVALYGIALSLTFYISAPVISQIQQNLENSSAKFETAQDIAGAIEQARVPVQSFLQRLTTESDREFFLEATDRVWDEEAQRNVSADDFTILVPSFLVAELKRAFQIGFMIYLPFVVIDLVVTTVLMGMGMQMVSPTLISTPFKIFLFITVEGWTRLIQGLILSYA